MPWESTARAAGVSGVLVPVPLCPMHTRAVGAEVDVLQLRVQVVRERQGEPFGPFLPGI